MVSWLRVFLFTLLLGLFGMGCKQGLNESCQADEDCEQGLTCSRQTGQCIQPGSSPDAAPASDANVPDAPVDAAEADAPVDANEADAPVDAAEPDAAP